jgi:dynein heavy chain
MVDTFKGAMPIVVALRNENLKDHHWKQIKDLIQADFDIQDPEFTLQSLIDLNAVQFQEEISGIATQAQNEASLKAQIAGLEEQWKNIEFLTKPHRGGDVPILDEIEDIYTTLDESIANVNMILGSRYVKPLREEAEIWKKNLLTLNNIVDEWVNCQKQWIYLENIFAAPDIKRQLPQESQKFEQVDKFFKNLMNKTTKHSNCLRIVKQMPNLPDQLKN